MGKFLSFENLAQLTKISGRFLEASFVFLKDNTGFLKTLSFLISTLLLWGIIYFTRGTIKEMRKMRSLNLRDLLGIGTKFHPRILKAWGLVLELLETKEEDKVKLAVIEADRLLDHLLIVLGYKGVDAAERFGQISPSHFSNAPEILKAHELALKLSEDSNLNITFEGAQEIIEVYKKAFEEVGLLDTSNL